MADRSVRTVLSANIAGFVGPMQRAAQVAVSTGKDIAGAAAKSSAEWDAVGSGMLKTGAALAVGLGLTVKAAMDWESAFAGVKKTVDGTPQQINALEGELRGMARTMAASHEEIAAVAEAAGQLGVATPAIAGFTKTMIMLGETTNLTADDAATSLAQIMNVMQTAPDKVGNLASTLVALGNAGASTESEILGLTQRIASAGKQIGLSEEQVMGYASALANVGVEVEAGGTAMSMTFLKLEQITRRGGTALQTVSKVAGVDFAQAFGEDAAGATQQFIEGLGRVQAAGGDVTGILRSLGITGVREADAIRRLASSGTNLASALALASTSIKSQDAILAEYAARAATTESKVQVAWNNIKDAAIDAGGVLLPMVAQAAESVSGFAQAFAQMPSGARSFAVGAAAVAAVLLLIVGGGMKLIGTLVAVRANLAALGVSTTGLGAKAADMAGKYQGAATKLMAFLLVTQLLGQAQNALAQDTTRVTGNMDTLSKSGVDLAIANQQITDSMRGFSGQYTRFMTGNPLQTMGDGFRYLGDSTRNGSRAFNDFMDSTVGAITGIKSTGGILQQEFGKMDYALSSMASGGNLVGAQEAFRKLSDDAIASGESVEFAASFFPEYRAQLDQTAQTLGVGTLTGEDYAKWMRGEIPAAIKAVADAGGPLTKNLSAQQAAMAGVAGAAADAVTSLQKYASLQLQMSGGEIGFAAALADANKQLKERGKGLDLDTEKGRANQTSLNGIASAANSVLESMSAAGAGPETLEKKAKTMRAELAAVADKMGMTKSEAAAFAASLIAIPGEVAPTFSTPGATVSKQQAADLAAAVNAVPELAETKILAVGARPSKAEVNDFIGSLKGVPKEKKAVLKTIAELAGVDAARDALARLKGKEVTAKVEANTAGATKAKDAIAGVKGKTVTVTVDYKGRGNLKPRLAEGGLVPDVGFRPVARLASGGTVHGQSPHPKADNVPIWATAGEFMQPVAAVQHYGINVMEALRRQLIPRTFFSAIGLADGGQVDPHRVATSQPVPTGSMAAPPTWTATEGRQTLVQVTNHYPQAEPTSITTNRALQYAAALGAL